MKTITTHDELDILHVVALLVSLYALWVATRPRRKDRRP